MTLGFNRVSKIIGGKLATATVCTVMAVSSGSCTSEANNSLAIVWAQVPTVNMGGCSVTGTKGMTYLPSGTLDVGLDKDYAYDLYPLIENNLKKAPTANIEYNAIRITGVDVKLIPPPGVTLTLPTSCPAEFSHPISLKVDPVGTAALDVEAIKACHIPAIRKQFSVAKSDGGLSPNVQDQEVFTAVLRVQGEHGGVDIESAPFSFPIRVCLGCLQRGFAAEGFRDLDYPKIPDCRSLVENPYVGNACNIAQDFGPVLCCSTDGSGSPASIECPGRPRGMPVDAP